MQLPDQPQPPAHVTTTRYGRKWPPNRPDIITETIVKGWRERDPNIVSPARRPMPQHFSRAFAIIGWRASEQYFRASCRVIGRWVYQAGKESVLAERAAMKRNPHRQRLKAMMAAYWTGEPREPEWLNLG